MLTYNTIISSSALNNVKCIFTKEGKRYYPLHLVSLAAGLHVKQWKNHTNYLTKVEGHTDKYVHSFLPGYFYLLEGNDLREFKERFYLSNKPASIKGRSLWVADTTGALSYLEHLNKGTTPIEGTPLPTNTIPVTNPPTPLLPKKIFTPSNKTYTTNNTTYNTGHTTANANKLTEEGLSELLVKLSCLTNNPFRTEVMLLNTIDDATKSRRLDLVRNFNHKTVVYELKLNALTVEDIAKTIGEKGYIHLAEAQLKREHPLRFYFVAKGITKQAALLLKSMPDVRFITTQALMTQLASDALEDVHPDIRWQQSRHRIQPILDELRQYI